MARSSFRKILVAIEFPHERRQPGLARAAKLAAAFGARLELVHCVYSPYARHSRSNAMTFELERGAWLAERKADLEKLARRLRKRRLKVSARAIWDYPPFEGIVREALRSKPDLVVAESRRRPAGMRLFLANNDWQLIRLCPAPLLLVKGPSPYGKARVLAAIDPMHARDRSARLDKQILESARATAAALAGRLDVVHAYLPLSIALVGAGTEPVLVPADPRDERRHARAVSSAVDRVAAPLRLPKGRLHIEIGDSATVIPELAKRLRADVVVMGAVSRRGLDRLFLGHTAERVLDAIPCDVLVIKPAGFRTSVRRYAAFGRTLISAL